MENKETLEQMANRFMQPDTSVFVKDLLRSRILKQLKERK